MAIKKHGALICVFAVATAIGCAATLMPSLRAAGVVEHNGSVSYEAARTSGKLPRVEIEPELTALIDPVLNVIEDDSGSLAAFLEKLRALRSGEYEGAVNIVHIGDSHVQAGFWDERMRGHFSRDFGSGGRGIILPHRLTGTNEPRDYYIRTTDNYEALRATSNPSRQKLSYTGTGVLFSRPYPSVEIWARGGFDAVTVICHPDAPMLSPAEELLSEMQCVMGDTEENQIFYLNRRVDTLRLSASYLPGMEDPHPLYYGFVLHDGPGVVYHSIGANSAAFEHFQRHTSIPEGGAQQLLPDLIIVSLGTNNCYGRNYRSDNLRKVVEGFLGSLQENYPSVPVLVTTPRESCQRQGRKYVPNPNVADAARVIRECAREYAMACWNLYGAAGGKDVSEKWFELKLCGRDRIHLTERGYNLVGDMLYDAFTRYYNQHTTAPAGLARTDGIHYAIRPHTGFIRFTAYEITAAQRI